MKTKQNQTEEYILVLDTNSVYYDLDDDFSKIFNSNLFDLKQFIAKNKLNNVKVCIPEIVIQERVTQRVEQVVKVLGEFEKNHKKLKIFDVEIANIPQQEKVREKFSEFSKELSREGFVIYSLPKPSIKEVIERSYLKVTPFQSGGRGFKDTILWYSVLKNCKNKIILLVSNDKAFDKDYLSNELKEHGGKRLEIFNTIEDAKSFLRKEFNLDENVEKIHEQIKKDIEKEIGNILFDLIGEKYYSYKRMLIGGFFIKETVFKNISENYIFVDLVVRVRAKLFESPEEKENELYETAMYTNILKTPYWSPTTYHIYHPIEKDLIINLKLHKMEDDYNVAEHSIREEYGVVEG